MRVCERAAEAGAWSACYRKAGHSLGFVPMLGALHEGHASLLDLARRECDRVAGSIYLNPIQFDSQSDLEAYPETIESDLEMCRSRGVDLLFLGAREELLPDGFQSYVAVEDLTRTLCGASRPGHFRGVTTVVAQLLNIVQPHRAYFGLKDYQQAMVISRLVEDLAFDVEIRLGPTVRAPDGLALSSRNARLSAAERSAATAIFRGLTAAGRRVREGEERAAEIIRELRETIEAERCLRVDYVEVVDARTLRSFAGGKIQLAPHGALLAVAVFAGETRLIDNVVVEPEEPPRG